MKRIFLLLIPVIIFGCEKTPEQDSADSGVQWTDEVPVYSLDVTDSIGVEVGDDNYTFGMIVAVEFTPEGNIAVLDVQKYSVVIYDHAGNFLTRIGRQGSGPGEFLMPAGISFTRDSGLIVCDAMGQKLVFFNPDFSFSHEISGFFPAPPTGIQAVDSAGVIGKLLVYEQNEDGIIAGFMLARWDTTNVPTMEYYRKLRPFDLSNLSESAEGLEFSFDASSDGCVFRAPQDFETYLIEGYKADGEQFLTIEQDYKPVPKTQEEIEEEKAFIENRMRSFGLPSGMGIIPEPDPDRLAIDNIFFDGEDRLWVRRGWDPGYICDVYDLTGQRLFCVSIDGPPVENLRYWQLTVSNFGIIAFDVNPMDYAKLYILDFVESDNPF